MASLRSDFLILPSFFYSDQNVKQILELKEKTQNAVDWLLKLSQSYKGVIIGGSVVQVHEGKLYHSTPIIYDENIVDWYQKRFLNQEETSFFTAGSDIGMFMLNNIRFGVLIGEEIQNIKLIEELKNNQIHLIFNPNANPDEGKDEEALLQYENDTYLKPAKELDISIVNCDATGSFLGKKLLGRSLLATPKGISWRVLSNDLNKQILKDIMVQI
ncbi:MAG: carbon-nitrogen hydrolase family protein [Leptospiraceae bacterium]|nr:carbon-nitrogen hydrolase family protein [Leptospiraceae bacterium]